MKLKSLILGSVAAAGLSTAGFAADLGVLTSLDVCDSLGISGLTISSSDNCLAISGKVSYEFNWGDYSDVPLYRSPYNRDNVELIADDGINNWESKVESWLKFVGTASSDFGPASATIKLKNESKSTFTGAAYTARNYDVIIDEAFVSIGDTTTIMAGKKGSVANLGDDEPFNWLGLFGSQSNDAGVAYRKDLPVTGGHVIQVVSGLGNGLTVKVGLENLDGKDVAAVGGSSAVGAAAGSGTLVGVLEYAGEGITAHVTGLAGGVLDGTVENWAVHAGVTGTFDAFKARVAGAYGAENASDLTTWNVLGSVEGNFDMFTIALSGEAFGGTDAVGAAVATRVGVGGSVGATITEGVKINLGARWFDLDNSNPDTEGYQVAARLVAAVTETIELGAEVGVYGTNQTVASTGYTGPETDFYGKADLTWKPGGNFESSLGAALHQNGGYKVTFKASKEFK